MVIVSTVVWGVVGGLVRASYGLQKALTQKRKIRWGLFTFTLFEAAAIGALFGYFFTNLHPAVSFLLGIGATDLLENAYKFVKFTAIKIPST